MYSTSTSGLVSGCSFLNELSRRNILENVFFYIEQASICQQLNKKPVVPIQAVVNFSSLNAVIRSPVCLLVYIFIHAR